MRRAITFAVLLTMAVLAPTPASACAMSSSLIAEGETTKTQCDGMDMQMDVQDDVSHLSHLCQSSMNCCLISQTLWPEPQFKLDKNVTLIAPVIMAVESGAILIGKTSTPVFQRKAPSPPTSQSLLCTFLI